MRFGGRLCSTTAACIFRAVVSVTLLLLTSTIGALRAQTISTVAGGFNPSTAASENFCEPIWAVANHGTDVYVLSCNQIFKVDSQGKKLLLAGNGMSGFNGDNILATSASLGRPHSVSLDPVGNLYIYDNDNARVREVDHVTGNIKTIAGTGVPGFNGDGPATSVEIGDFGAVFSDASGNVFIADSRNSRIREISGGMMQTIAGDGVSGFNGDGEPATSKSLGDPKGVFVDGSGNVFFADSGNGLIREVVKATGLLQTVAGGPGIGFSGDGGPATSAMLDFPSDVVADSAGNFFLSDRVNNRIRKFTLGGNIQTVAGNGSALPASCTTSLDLCIGDGGPATSAIIFAPDVVSLDNSGNIFVATFGLGIQEIVAGAVPTVKTFAGNGALGFGGDNGPATGAQLLAPIDAVADTSGNIYIADTFGTIREVVAATGDVKTIAGGGDLSRCTPHSESCIGNGGPALGAAINPQALAVDGAGNLFVADGVGEIREIVAATGIIQSVAGSFALAPGDSGDGGPATSATLGCPTGVTLDALGNIFIADDCNANVREVVKATGNIQTVAGDPNGMTFAFSGDGGPATKATFTAPIGVYVDGSGNLFISDALENRIREVVAATGIINTVAGNGIAGFGGDGGPARNAEINNPTLLHGDSHGNIFIADFANNSIREFTVGGNIQTAAGNGVEGFTGDGGPPGSAELSGPSGVFVDAANRLLVADFFNARVRLVVTAESGTQPTATTLHSSLDPAVGGQSVTFMAQVTSSSSGTPAGTVTFLDNGVQIGTGRLSNGQATFTTTSLGMGAHPITAQYSGALGFAASESAQLTQTISVAQFGPGPSAMPAVTRGQSIHIALSLLAAPGSNVTFNLSCSNLPANSSCVFSPNPVTPGAPPGGSQVQMTFATQAPTQTMTVQPQPVLGPNSLEPFGLMAVLAGIGAIFGSRKASRCRFAWRAAVALLVLAAVIAGCSGSGNNNTKGGSGGTPTGIANLTVTANSSSTTLTQVIPINVQ